MAGGPGRAVVVRAAPGRRGQRRTREPDGAGDDGLTCEVSPGWPAGQRGRSIAGLERFL